MEKGAGAAGALWFATGLGPDGVDMAMTGAAAPLPLQGGAIVVFNAPPPMAAAAGWVMSGGLAAACHRVSEHLGSSTFLAWYFFVALPNSHVTTAHPADHSLSTCLQAPCLAARPACAETRAAWPASSLDAARPPVEVRLGGG